MMGWYYVIVVGFPSKNHQTFDSQWNNKFKKKYYKILQKIFF